jgi:23S rRNA pseudouridine1911/1915/1917 synthase
MALCFVVEAGHPPERVDKLLTRLMPDTSRGTIQRWIGEGRVRLNGRPCRAKDAAAAGATIEVEPGPRPATEAEADASVVFGVAYEDAHLIVVDKPAGLVVHPARGHATGTLVNGLLARGGFEAIASDPRDPAGSLRPGIVHRIDKDTSGLLVVAKDERTREGLKQQLQARSMERRYLGLTLRVPSVRTISTGYRRDPKSRLRFTSRFAGGRPALTHVEVLETLAQGRAALVACRLETGRTHQIRVHLAEQSKTPLLGDALYGVRPTAPLLQGVARDLGRQALHAAVLGFEHPLSGERLRFESALPPDFQRALDALRAG